MEIKRDDIKYFIHRELVYPEKEIVRSSLIVMLIVCIPTAIFGAYSNITKIFMLPIILLFSIWAVLLLRKAIDRSMFDLFSGLLTFFLSVSLLIGAYKEFSSSGQDISLRMIFFTLSLYLMCIILNITIAIQLIKKGYYKQDRKRKINVPLCVGLSTFVGISFGRTLLGSLDQKVDHLGTIILLIASFFLAFGTSNILRYYLATKIKD